MGNRTPRGTPAIHYPARLRTTPQACRYVSSPRDVDEQSLGGWGRRLFVNECHLCMDQWMRFGDRDRRIVLCWPNSGGYSRRNRASPRCLQCAGAVCFVNREAAARSILARSTSVITQLLWPSGASRTPADAPNCTRGWLARLAATRTKKVGFGTLSSRRKSENRTKARRLRPANAGPNTPPRKPEYRPARGRARVLLPRVYIDTCN